MRAALLLSLGLCLALAGCSDSGPQRAEVAGDIAIDGKPVEEGAINFIPDKGTKGPGAGGIIKNGKYRIPRAQGPVVGVNRVELTTQRKTGRKIQDPTAKPGVLTDELVEAFPPAYNVKSTVHREVKAGTNQFDFDVRIKKER